MVGNAIADVAGAGTEHGHALGQLHRHKRREPEPDRRQREAHALGLDLGVAEARLERERVTGPEGGDFVEASVGSGDSDSHDSHGATGRDKHGRKAGHEHYGHDHK